jgi:4-amino-4-deoxy-L-arabinose transferase-like glycosyltransferase
MKQPTVSTILKPAASGTHDWTCSRTVVAAVVLLVLALQAAQFLFMVHRESLTFDEDDHMFSGYMMWKTGDYGLNPEHPPLVKLLAALPVLGERLWVPPLQGRFFKTEAYLDGRDWLARNDGASQRMVFRMRASVGLLALLLSLTVFFAAREWFGTRAALVALVLASFDPDLLAHSALVTTDIGVTLFFLATIYAFYRYVQRPGWGRLVVAGVVAGLLLATKHSGILIAPMLVLLIVYEVATAPREGRKRVAGLLLGGLAGMVVLGTLVLWAFYGFRYAARPAGLRLNPSLADYTAPLSHFNAAVVLAMARWHLLPESYLMGLVDVKRMAQFYPTFLFGKVYAHGQWWYFPAVIAIKSTLGLLALVGITIFAAVKGRLGRHRALAYLWIPGLVYLGVAMAAGIDIGARHILPLDAFAVIFAGAGAAALARTSRTWAWVCGGLVALHVASALAVFPNDLAYANEAWGGAKNVHNLLSDANVDWAQQLLQVKSWQDRHPNEACWFAYIARPEVDPAVYGIRCHAMPTLDTFWVGGSDLVPETVQGTVLISAGDLSGCEWASGKLNPYRAFQRVKPAEMIDDSVFVYRGDFEMAQAAAMSRAQRAEEWLTKHQPQRALALAQEAVAIDPEEIYSETALGDAAAALGQKQEARSAWEAAMRAARQLEPEAQVSYLPGLEQKLRTLGS